MHAGLSSGISHIFSVIKVTKLKKIPHFSHVARHFCVSFLILMLSIVPFQPVWSSVATADFSLPAEVVDAMIAAGIEPSTASFYVQALDGTSPVINIHAHLSQNPASLMKLVMTYGALELLGPTYTWKTRLTTDAPVSNGTLEGSLYIQAGGDPRFLLEHLWLTLRSLRQQGIRKIRDSVVIDRRLFEVSPHDSGQFDGEARRAYNTGPEAFLLNFKATAIRFWPGTHHVLVTLDPPHADTKVRTDIRLTDEPCPTLWRSGLNFDLSDVTKLVIRGVYSRQCGPQAWFVNLYERDDYLRQTWRDLWQEDIHLKEGVAPEGARPLVTWTSAPLAEIVRDVNKLSNNVMAQQIFLSLSADNIGRAESSAAVLRRWLEDKHIDVSTLVLENGSGLSRMERFSAQGLGQLLVHAYHSAVMPEFMASLPIVGLDGTMRRRLVDAEVKGRAHIKTGTLREVRAIAGYVLASSGRRYVVVSIINSPNAAAGQSVHDALLKEIMRW